MPKRVKMGDPKVAIAYARCSTDKQDTSLEAQGRAIDDYAERHGITVVALYIDDGANRKTTIDQRRGLPAALAALTETGAGLLLAQKRDRIGHHAEDVEALAAKAGAELRTTDGAHDADADSPEGVLRRSMDDLLSKYEIANIRRRTRGAMAVLAERGLSTGTPRYGFHLAADGKHVEADPAEQAVIRRVLDGQAQGVRLAEIQRQLEADGVRGRTGRPLAKTQLRNIVAAHVT